MFSLNSPKKIFFKKIAGLELDFLMKRQRLDHCSTETQVTEKIVKLILIHASVDSLNSLNSANFAPFRENPIISRLKPQKKNVLISLPEKREYCQ